MATPRICDDLTVLELGNGSVAAVLAGVLLADNGARVMKVEPPGGDRLRAASPSGYLVWCRGKESLVLEPCPRRCHARRTAAGSTSGPCSPTSGWRRCAPSACRG
jgi:hypothetical protein